MFHFLSISFIWSLVISCSFHFNNFLLHFTSFPLIWSNFFLSPLTFSFIMNSRKFPKLMFEKIYKNLNWSKSGEFWIYPIANAAIYIKQQAALSGSIAEGSFVSFTFTKTIFRKRSFCRFFLTFHFHFQTLSRMKHCAFVRAD